MPISSSDLAICGIGTSRPRSARNTNAGLIEIARWTVAAAFALIPILASATDIKYRRIPNWTVVAIVILYIPWIFVGPGVSLGLSFAAAANAFFAGVTFYALGLGALLIVFGGLLRIPIIR
jgi:hypothetical protein